MFKGIVLKNFKCLDGKDFSLKNINIFSGYNGRGKSSLMQGILLFSQSFRSKGSFEKLHLTGEYIYLGSYDELLFDDTDDNVGFIFRFDDPQYHKVEFNYSMSLEDEFLGQMTGCRVNDEDYYVKVGDLGEEINSKGFSMARPLPQGVYDHFNNVHFVSANRVGPVKFVEKKEVPDFLRVGADGAFTINTLAAYTEEISSEMNISSDDNSSHSLTDLVSMWLSYIMSGGAVSLERPERKKSSVLSLGFGIAPQNDKRLFSSYNVGFGYSYILSIVVTALIAKKGSTVIVENPEAHLHPKAQSRLTELLSKMSNRGVQIFIETHSEHIVNGFRLAALRPTSPITHEDLALFFFDEDYSVKYLTVQANGKIDNWPEGFFDQAKYDAAEILRRGLLVAER